MYRKFGRGQKLSSPPPFQKAEVKTTLFCDLFLNIGRLMRAAITSHAHIWGFHGNVHIAWGFYYIGIIILHLIPSR